MKRLEQFAACSLFGMAAICGSSILLAQNSFTVQPSPRPQVFSIDHGRYHCDSCNPAIDVPANGTDQRVDGYADGDVYDTISVTIIDPKTIEVTTKRVGRIYFKQVSSVAADGNTLYITTTEFSDSSEKPLTGETTATRVGAMPSGAHAASGSWRAVKVRVEEN